MATLCRNCATPLIFDPATQKVVCRSCGASWDAEEVESSDKQYQEKPSLVEGVDEGLKEEFIECYVYSCNSCGGEININGTEASTRCIYCGSSSVVFSRVSKEKAPEFIIPFSITKEDALDRIKKRFRRGAFIPKELKNLKVDVMRGIYIPCWLANAYHLESTIISSTESKDSKSVTRYSNRSGRMIIRNLPVDASLILSDESAQRLEPYDFSEVKLFDEDYLLGFYSNISDIRVGDLRDSVCKRAQEAFEEQAIEAIDGGNRKVVLAETETLIDQDLRYVLLPVWFVSFFYNGKHTTIMVNGQTGKVVGGVPWNEKLFKGIVAAGSVILATLLVLLFRFVLLPVIFQTPVESAAAGISNNNLDDNIMMFYMAFITMGILVFTFGFEYYRKAKKQLERSQDESIFNFNKKRQG